MHFPAVVMQGVLNTFVPCIQFGFRSHVQINAAFLKVLEDSLEVTTVSHTDAIGVLHVQSEYRGGFGD